MKKLRFLSLAAIGILSITKADAQTEGIIYTNMGNISFTLADTLVKRTVDSFISRVTTKFYDGLIFHRVIDGFMIQGGDPLGNGMGGPGYSTPDEFNPKLKNTPGSFAMANSGPNTNGSQFYINLVNNGFLDNHYVVFGTTTSNFSVVQAIGKVPKDGSDKPLTNVTMDSVRITKYPASISTIKDELKVKIAPNPSNGVFTVDLPKSNTKVEVMTLGGAVIYTGEGKKSITVDIHDKPKGMYILHVTGKDGVSDSRLIVQ